MDARIRYLTDVDLPLPRLDLLMRAIRRCPVLSASDPEMHDWYRSRESGLGLESDVVPVVWLQPLLVEGSFQVRMMVPQGFEAYAGIFFPSITTSPGRRRPGAMAGSRTP